MQVEIEIFTEYLQRENLFPTCLLHARLKRGIDELNSREYDLALLLGKLAALMDVVNGTVIDEFAITVDQLYQSQTREAGD